MHTTQTTYYLTKPILRRQLLLPPHNFFFFNLAYITPTNLILWLRSHYKKLLISWYYQLFTTSHELLPTSP